MVPEQSSPEVREAIEELQLYLSDVLPPLVVADSFKLLINRSPSLMAACVQSWTAARYRSGSGIKISDYMFYAIRKIFLIGEFRLVAKEPFSRFFEELKTLVLAFCPEGERETLRRNMERLGESMGAVTTSVDELIRRSGERVLETPSGPSLSREEQRGLRRFSLLIERLGAAVPAENASEEEAPDPLAQALAVAARSSRTSEEFDRNLEKLRELGMKLETADVFRALAALLPGWVSPGPAAGEPGTAGEGGAPAEKPAPESTPVEAMHRIVVQPEDPGEVARRFSEMVRTSCDRFNEGALPQAVTMLDLADRIIREKGVAESAVEVVRLNGNDRLDIERMRRYAETPRYHPLLRRVLNFFIPTSPQGLLADLLRETKRDRRKLLLQLLEVHGAPARHEALGRLRSPLGQAEGDEKWYFRRNLLYLLRRIPMAETVTALEEDVDAAARHAVVPFPAPLLKEAVANLGQLNHERAESTLISLLGDLEKMLAKPADAPYDPREIRLLLDRVVAALAHFGTDAARKAVVDHGLKKKAELGDAISRLSELAGQDLSGDVEVLERLLAALRVNSPRKVLGILLHQNDNNAKHLIEALSATPAPPVRAAFESLARRFPNLEVGKAAASALATLGGPPPVREAPSDTRSGEMERFGLPALVQSLAEAGLSGLLTLKDQKGEIAAEIVLKDGKMKSCEARGLNNQEAFYGLLERPAPASFVFARQPSDGRPGAPAGPLLEIVPLCLEGMRRYDEFQQAAALVPDDARPRRTAARPDHHPDELDGMFVNGLWNLVSSGATPRDCEGAMKADPYRIRRQLAYWLESGALTTAY